MKATDPTIGKGDSGAGDPLGTGSIWMLMCAHASFDLTAVAIIYWDLESAVAHLVLT